MDRVRYIINIAIVALLFASISIQRDGRLAGRDVMDIFEGEVIEETIEVAERVLSDGSLVINSSSLASDVIGYGGRTPVEIVIQDGVIDRIEILPNSETPSFQESITKGGFFESWYGMTLEEAAVAQIDAVSGATFSSEAFAENIRRAVRYASAVEVDGGFALPKISVKQIIALAVLLLGVVLTFMKSRNRALRLVLMALNVVVLGFWCGSFLSLTSFVSWIGNGFNFSLALISVAMLMIAIIMPLLGRRGSYCTHHCPLGSAQELMGLIPMGRLKISPDVQRWLGKLRYYLLLSLLFMMWLGVGFEIMEYEAFSAFLLGSASPVVLTMAVCFLILSIFTPRPYCRFVCPTGALITTSQRVNGE